jgi:hypothetical protein
MLRLRGRLLSAGAAGWKELDSSLSAHVEEWLVEAGRAMRIDSAMRIGPAVLALTLAVICMIASEWVVSHRVALYMTENRQTHAHGPHLSVRTAAGFEKNETLVDRFISGMDGVAVRSWGQLAPSSETAAVYSKFPAVHAPQERLGHSSEVRQRYAALARLYLKPFPNISRHMYMDYLDSGGRLGQFADVCSGCFLLQVKKGEIYVYDPKQVRSTMATFREIRMREAIHWTTRAVEAGVIDNTELVISTTDGIVSTSRNHTYRMPEPDPVERPIFTLTHCNCSSNIPFPMIFTDLLRRAFKEEFWKARSGSLARWDEMATQVLGTQRHESHVWARKKRQAVFRGAIRVPSSVKHAPDYERNCHKSGRTALFARTEHHLKKLEERQQAWRRSHWLWNALGRISSARIFRAFLDAAVAARGSWASSTGAAAGPVEAALLAERECELELQRSGASFEPLLDVQLTGRCGGRTYSSDSLSMEQQSSYRYTVHAEGNGFWADRLAILLFGSSAVIKQLTPCGMFFEPLLRAYKHFIPVDYEFKDVVRQVEWARANDAAVRQIVEEARSFAGDYLTVAGISAYTEEVLREYTRRLDKEARVIHIHPHAVKLYPVN